MMKTCLPMISLALGSILISCLGTGLDSVDINSQAAINGHAEFREGPNGRYLVTVGRIRAELGEEGLLAQRGDDMVRLRLASWGRPDMEEPVGGVAPTLGTCATVDSAPLLGACQRAVVLRHPGLVEQWRTRPGGLEQAWEVEVRPAGDGPLVLDLAIGDATSWKAESDELGARLVGSSGLSWRYSGLKAWDARGVPLAARMEATDSGLRLLVNDHRAAYPLIVDPTLSEATKLTASDGRSLEYFGSDVSRAGDVDGDGYDDVIVGAYYGTGRRGDSGAAYIYHGSISGVDPTDETKLSASDGEAYDQFGSSVSGSGDVNGDGYDDVIVGAWNWDNKGAVYLYTGSNSGVDMRTETLLYASDAESDDDFGQSVSSIGDLNGDGYADVIVGAIGTDDTDTANPPDSTHQHGTAYVYLGSASGIDASTEFGVRASDRARNQEFGYSVSDAGDVNGDGYSDVIVGARGDADNGSEAGAAYVYHGGKNGIDPSSETKLIASDGAPETDFGRSVALAGDLDGDGFGDVIAGAYGNGESDEAAGAAYVYFGSSTGVDGTTESKLTASDGEAGDAFGYSVGWAGDVDNDGYDDVVIGSLIDMGAAYVYTGGEGGLDIAQETRLGAADAASGDNFGQSVSGAGDVDGNGYDDVIAGAVYDDDNGSSSGSAYVFHGTCDALTWYGDDDEDGYGDPQVTTSACEQPSGYVDNDDDCDDTEPLAWTAAAEVCDGADNDCDGTVDNHDAVDVVTWYGDADGDGFGGTSFSKTVCEAPDSYVDNDDDCDDLDPASHPDAAEVCDGADNDCDGVADNVEPADAPIWYADADGDGYTDAELSAAECEAPSGYAQASEEADCDDTDASAFPGAAEIAGDGIDQDCDGFDLAREGDTDGASCGGCASGTGPGRAAWPWLMGLGLLAARQRRVTGPACSAPA